MDVCSGEWVMNVSPELPTGISPTTTTFSMSPVIGLCPAVPMGMYATGTLSGTCLDVTGFGTTAEGHRFFFTGAQGALAFSGEVTGAVSWTVDVLNGGGCSRFLIHGSLVLTHAIPGQRP